MKVSTTQTILIVEDSEDDYEYTEQALREANLKNPIHRCVDGQDALDYLSHLKHEENKERRSFPGIILLDLNMPGIDGREVLRTVKGDDKLKRIPVIVLTTSSDEWDISECYKEGANTYIQKPVNIDNFLAAIRRLKEYWFEIAILPKVE